MKKIVKRLVSLTCVAALAATCCVGASAASTYNGRVGGYSWSASSALLNSYGYFRASTSGGWSPVYGGTIRVKANYSHATGPGQTDGWVYAPSNRSSVTYDCIHSPTISDQSSDHNVSINGSSQSYRLYPS